MSSKLPDRSVQTTWTNVVLRRTFGKAFFIRMTVRVGKVMLPTRFFAAPVCTVIVPVLVNEKREDLILQCIPLKPVS